VSKALLYDATLCIGCKQCEIACAERNGLPYDDTIAAEAKLTDHKLTAVLSKDDRFMRKLCMNCNDPACASVCPVGAFQKTALGPVVYDSTRCMGCRYCMLACPFQVPAYQWNNRLPIVRKCDMCSDRVAAGNVTACTEICPTGANKFGERDELVAEAKQRLHDNPQNYFPHILGLEEVGGTSVLMLSAVPFAEFGMRTDLPHEPLPGYTWAALTHVPDVVVIGSVLLGGVYWITHRREEVAAVETTSSRAASQRENGRES
jgi:formate dehydrogenase iron-sulfur subunit